MNDERFSTIATHALGVIAFILLAVVAERSAVWTIAARQFSWDDPGPFLHFSEVRFWILVAGLTMLAIATLGLAWRSRGLHIVHARVAIFAAFTCMITALIAMTAAFLVVRSHALILTLGDLGAVGIEVLA